MPGAAAPSRAAAVLIWAGLGLVLMFLYAPLVPPAPEMASAARTPVNSA